MRGIVWDEPNRARGRVGGSVVRSRRPAEPFSDHERAALPGSSPGRGLPPGRRRSRPDCGQSRFHVSTFSFIPNKQFGELLFQRFDLGTITDLNVGILRVMERIVLVIILGPVEARKWRQLSDDPFRENLRIVELRDISGRNALLLLIDVEDCGTIRGAHVWSLAVQLCRIVSDGKKDAL